MRLQFLLILNWLKIYLKEGVSTWKQKLQHINGEIAHIIFCEFGRNKQCPVVDFWPLKIESFKN